jgi:hypothetical protein
MARHIGKIELQVIDMARRMGWVVVTDSSLYDRVFVGGSPTATKADAKCIRLNRRDWRALVRSRVFIPCEDPETSSDEEETLTIQFFMLNVGADQASPDLAKTTSGMSGCHEYQGIDGEAFFLDCGDYWWFYWEVDERCSFGKIPKGLGLPIVFKSDWRVELNGEETSPPNTFDPNPWKTIRSMMRWLGDLPTLKVEFLPANEGDEVAVREAFRSFAVRYLAEKEGRS